MELFEQIRKASEPDGLSVRGLARRFNVHRRLLERGPLQARRQEKASITTGSNLPFSEWGPIIPDPLVAAIVDRLGTTRAGKGRRAKTA